MTGKMTLPNCITMCRILGTLCLLFIQPLSGLFFLVYTLTGLTDALDGYIARKTNTTSQLGAKLDSIADLLFYTVMIIRIFPVLWALLPRVIWVVIGVIVFIRLCAYGVAAVKYHRFASIHNRLNKVTGAAVFAIPYMLTLPIAAPYCWGVCAVAGLSSSAELLFHLTAKTYNNEG